MEFLISRARLKSCQYSPSPNSNFFPSSSATRGRKCVRTYYLWINLKLAYEYPTIPDKVANLVSPSAVIISSILFLSFNDSPASASSTVSGAASTALGLGSDFKGLDFGASFGGSVAGGAVAGAGVGSGVGIGSGAGAGAAGVAGAAGAGASSKQAATAGSTAAGAAGIKLGVKNAAPGLKEKVEALGLKVNPEGLGGKGASSSTESSHESGSAAMRWCTCQMKN
eukprot:1189565-Prorocentrum_minimum.AAC.1